MDLASGYLLVEEVAVDRTYDTWHGLGNRGSRRWAWQCHTW